MLWKGRKQSFNIIDIRSFQMAEISITWGDGGDIVIDTDGSVYGAAGEFAMNISLIPANPPTRYNDQWMPHMTTGQRNRLREIIEIATLNSPMAFVKQPNELEEVVLAQFAQSILNGR